jgi:DNA-binding transcriptional ArsR family regulator
MAQQTGSAANTRTPDVARMFAALGHESRVRVLRLLLASHPHGLVVGELQDQLEIPASTLSHHLEALKHEGLVSSDREGRFLRYRAGTERLQVLLNFLYAECCTRQPLVDISIPAKQA